MSTGRAIAEENLSNTDASLWLSGTNPPFGWWNRWMIAFSTISFCATLTVIVTFYLHWNRHGVFIEMILDLCKPVVECFCTIPGYPITEDVLRPRVSE